MATVQRSASKIAWSTKKQSAFGTALAKADLTKFLKLQEPVIIDESAEHWTDRGMIGAGHDWETQRGKLRQYVRFEVPVQPLPVDFLGYLLALFFSDETPSVIESGLVYGHTAEFQTLDTRPEAYTTTFAVLEDGNDYYIQDIACRSLTLRGDGSNRLEAGGSFIGSKIGGSLSSYTWPAASSLRFLYNYAGVFTIDSNDKKSQLRSFDLSLESGLNEELAWLRVAAEANRIYPSAWPYTPERDMDLSLSLLAQSGDLATFRAAQQAGTEVDLVVSCLGEEISGSTGPDNDEIRISVPKAVYSEMSHDYDNGLLNIDLTVEGHYDPATGGPLSVLTTEGSISQYF